MKFYKTAAKTAKENGLVLRPKDGINKASVFDLSLISECSMITPECYEKIIHDTLKYISIGNTFNMVYFQPDPFNLLCGKFFFNKIIVENEFKKLYVIYKLVEIDLVSYQRHNMYMEMELVDKIHIETEKYHEYNSKSVTI